MSKLPPVTVVPVTTRRQRSQFLKFPWQHYEGDPNWVPPLRQNQKELVNYKYHPFYDENEIQTFLAMCDDQVCGRVAAIVDLGHNRYYKEQRGMFGFFESINDRVVSDALFDACKEWFSERGIHDMRGPLNPSMNYECGLLIDGFDSPPSFMMTYNHDYYQELIEGYGFEKSHDLLSFYAHKDMLEGIDDKMGFVAEEAVKRFNLNVRRLDRKRFTQDVQTFVNIYNESLPGQWGFVPLTNGELNHQAKGLKHLIVPEITAIAEDETGPVAAVFGLVDYNPLIREIDGKLFPFGFLKLLWKRRTLNRVRLVSTNVLPKYQRWGLGIVLMASMIYDAIEWGIVDCEFSWVLESNTLSRGTLERGGAKLVKTHRIFDCHWQ